MTKITISFRDDRPPTVIDCSDTAGLVLEFRRAGEFGNGFGVGMFDSSERLGVSLIDCAAITIGDEPPKPTKRAYRRRLKQAAA